MFGKGFDIEPRVRAPAKDARFLFTDNAERAGMKG